MEISDLKSAAMLNTRYYASQKCEDFQMRCLVTDATAKSRQALCKEAMPIANADRY